MLYAYTQAGSDSDSQQKDLNQRERFTSLRDRQQWVQKRLQVSTEQNCEQGLGNSPPCYMPNGNTETYSPEDMQRMFIAALFIIYHPEKKKEKSAAWKKRVMQSGNRAEVITVNTEEGRLSQEGPSFWWECRWGAASPPKCWFLGMFVWGKPKHLWLTILSRMLKELPWSL